MAWSLVDQLVALVGQVDNIMVELHLSDIVIGISQIYITGQGYRDKSILMRKTYNI